LAEDNFNLSGPGKRIFFFLEKKKSSQILVLVNRPFDGEHDVDLSTGMWRVDAVRTGDRRNAAGRNTPGEISRGTKSRVQKLPFKDKNCSLKEIPNVPSNI